MNTPKDHETQAAATSPRRWMIAYTCWNDAGEMQTNGAHFYDEYPPDSEVLAVQETISRGNIWARAFRLEVKPAEWANSAICSKEEPV